jgi:F0F1-type ATP synthase membrane subunit b/b'
MIAVLTSTANLIVNVLTVFMIVGGFAIALPYFKRKAINQSIEDLEHALNAARERIDAAEQTAQEAKTEAQNCHIEAERWRTKYEESARYSAAPAVAHFERELSEHRQQVAERHQAILEAAERAAVHQALQTEACKHLAELVSHNTAVIASIANKLDVDAPSY